jgi:aquaporin Z
VVQVVGAIAAAAALYVIANGQPGFEMGGFAANGYGPLSPGLFDMKAALLAEVIATFFFVLIIMRVTAPGAAPGFAPIAIGLALTLIHLVLIPVTNTSVNPARSTGPALIVGGWALQQLWLFWVAPLIGAALAGTVYRWGTARTEAQTQQT